LFLWKYEEKEYTEEDWLTYTMPVSLAMMEKIYKELKKRHRIVEYILVMNRFELLDGDVYQNNR
jgi:hypothetical protein